MQDIYIVGGYVRDKLMNISSNDIDFTFVINGEGKMDVSIEEGFSLMKSWLLNEGFTIFLETPEMVTIRAKFPRTEKYREYIGQTGDFVLARREVQYNDNSRRPDFVVGTLYDDLFRRDFTVNAIAMDMEGKLIDFFGGIDDIQGRILRTPDDDPMRTMMDDPLRVLRALRFSVTKDFTICEPLMNAMRNDAILDKLFNVVSGDRIREELTKMFKVSTVKTIRALIDFGGDRFIERLFAKGLWLKPTTEKR